MKNSRKIKDIMLKTGLFDLASIFAKGKSVAILRYHSIVRPEDNFYASPSITLSPEVFEKQVSYFTQRFNIISLDTVKTCIETKAPFPERAVVFTFDDGYRDNFTAYKILKKYNAAGTFYLVSSCIDNASILWLFEVIYLVKHTRKESVEFSFNGTSMILTLLSLEQKESAIRKITAAIKSNNIATREKILDQLRNQTADVEDYKEKADQVMLTWPQVKEMADNGMTIGGHTTTHLNLPNADPIDAEKEIVECKRQIQAHTGKEVLHFSYPNGGPYDYYNDTIIEFVKKAGYATSTTSNNGISDHDSDPFELSRIRVTPYLSEIIYQICAEPILSCL